MVSLKLLEVFFFPLLILASVVGLTVFFKKQHDKGIIALLFILSSLIAFGISIEYKKVTAAEMRFSPQRAHVVESGYQQK
jgi:hypothetical protein